MQHNIIAVLPINSFYRKANTYPDPHTIINLQTSSYIQNSYFIQTFKERTPVKCCYVLKSVSLLRKYIAILDLPITMLKTEALMPLVSQMFGLGGSAALAGGASSSVRSRAMIRPQELLYVSAPAAVYKAKTAMEKHESQMVWFRKIYVVVSRYMSINELRRVM